MKIIFSRKGFDSQYGGVPSPILPDGGMTSFPIPSKYGRPLKDLSFQGRLLAELVSDLKPGVNTVHLDPDLEFESVPRELGWLPNFGQVGRAQSHLANEGVDVGDVFLFFGWFRQIERSCDRWQYKRSAPNIHSLFGWLQVGKVINVPKDSPDTVAKRYPWLADHPHVQYQVTIGNNNTLYVSADKLHIDGQPTNAPGGGMFKRWMPALQLTEPGCTRSKWLLPGWMAPSSDLRPMSMHGNLSRWEVAGEQVRLQTVGKGQEFVLDVGTSSLAKTWLRGLIDSQATKQQI